MKQQRGQTLIEIILAFAIAAIVLSAVIYAVINSLKNAQSSKNQTLATQYAQQALDIVRNMRYADYATFSTLASGSYCLADTCTTISNQSGNICGPVGLQCSNTPNVPSSTPVFIRQVAIQQSSSACSGTTGTGTQVTVTVSWTDGQCVTGAYCHQIAIPSCITNFDVIPTP